MVKPMTACLKCELYIRKNKNKLTFNDPYDIMKTRNNLKKARVLSMVHTLEPIEESPYSFRSWCLRLGLNITTAYRHLKQGKYEPDQIVEASMGHSYMFLNEPKKLTVEDLKRKPLYPIGSSQPYPMTYKTTDELAQDSNILHSYCEQLCLELCRQFDEPIYKGVTYPSAPDTIEGYTIVQPIIAREIKNILDLRETKKQLKIKAIPSIQLIIEHTWPYNLINKLIDPLSHLTVQQILLINEELFEYEMQQLTEFERNSIYLYYRDHLSSINIAQKFDVTRTYVHAQLADAEEKLKNISHVMQLDERYQKVKKEAVEKYGFNENRCVIHHFESNIDDMKSVDYLDQPFIFNEGCTRAMKALYNELGGRNIQTPRDLVNLTLDQWLNDIDMSVVTRDKFIKDLTAKQLTFISLLQDNYNLNNDTLLTTPLELLNINLLLDRRFYTHIAPKAHHKKQTLMERMNELNILTISDFFKQPGIGVNAVFKTEQRLNQLNLTLVGQTFFKENVQPNDDENEYIQQLLRQLSRQLIYQTKLNQY